MIRFVIRRLLLAIPALFGLIALTFFLIQIAPGDPAAEIAGESATPEQIEQVRRDYGFDQPIVVQFGYYLARIARGDLGKSYFSGNPIADDIRNRLPATLELVTVILTLSAVLGIALGVMAGARHNQPTDYAIRGFTVAGLALANFWIAIMLQLLFSMELDWLPLRGRFDPDVAPPATVTGLYLIDSLLALRPDAFLITLSYLALPVLAQMKGPVATIARFTRSGMLDTLQKDFVTYEYAVGYPRRVVIWTYVLRNSVVAAVTQIGLLFGNLLGGTVVIEAIFDFPGIGLYLVQSIFNADYNAVLAVTLVIGGIYAVVNIAVDVAHAIIDPRVAEQL